MNDYQKERVADLVREEFPHKGVYSLIALNASLLLLVMFAGFHAHDWQNKQDREFYDYKETQTQWNISLKGQLEGLKATIEFGPRITALEQGMVRQTIVLESIARKLGIKEELNDE